MLESVCHDFGTVTCFVSAIISLDLPVPRTPHGTKLEPELHWNSNLLNVAARGMQTAFANRIPSSGRRRVGQLYNTDSHLLRMRVHQSTTYALTYETYVNSSSSGSRTQMLTHLS